MKCRKRKSILLFVLCLVLLLAGLTVTSFAVTYANEYPSYIPLSGGAYFEVQCSLGRVSVVFPVAYKDNTFGFTGTGSNICNLTNSTVSGYLYTSTGTTYSARFTRQSTLEYQNTSSTWVSLSTTAIYNTNVQFIDDTSRKRETENYDIAKNERLHLIVIFIICGCTLFMSFMSIVTVIRRVSC